MNISLTISGGPALRTKLVRVMNQIPQITAAVLYREAESIMTRSKQEFVPTDMGALKASGHVQMPVLTATGASVTMGYGGAASKYAVYVHEGTGPEVGRPPYNPSPDMVEAIREWAVRHGIEEEAAFPIARAIGKRGLKPLKYLELPVNEARDGMERRLARAMGKEVERITGGRA